MSELKIASSSSVMRFPGRFKTPILTLSTKRVPVVGRGELVVTDDGVVVRGRAAMPGIFMVLIFIAMVIANAALIGVVVGVSQALGFALDLDSIPGVAWTALAFGPPVAAALALPRPRWFGELKTTVPFQALQHVDQDAAPNALRLVVVGHMPHGVIHFITDGKALDVYAEITRPRAPSTDTTG